MTDDEIIEIVEDHVGMGHGAWDMVSNEDLVAGFRIALATPAPAQPEAHQEDSLEWKLSCVIDYATGGKLSKPGWALATIKAAIDEHVNALYEEWSEDRDDDEESEEPDPLHVANERGEGEDAFPALHALTEAILTRADADFMQRRLTEAVRIMATHGWEPPVPFPAAPKEKP